MRECSIISHSIQDMVQSSLGLEESSINHIWNDVQQIYLESTFDAVSYTMVNNSDIFVSSIYAFLQPVLRNQNQDVASESESVTYSRCNVCAIYNYICRNLLLGLKISAFVFLMVIT